MAGESYRCAVSIGCRRPGTTSNLRHRSDSGPLGSNWLGFFMIGAVFTRARLKEIPMIAIPAVLGVLALWVAIWGYTDLIS